MSAKSYQEILSLVNQPSRYIGSEINAVRKPFDKARVKFALVFPDLYEIGMSHFGLQILYSMLNDHEDILVERVFAPGTDMENHLRENKIPIRTLESKRPLGHFDIIGFSLLYELNYTNMLNVLDLAGIPLRSDQRDESFPLVIAGGPCTCNPEPVSRFFDAIVIGDGEDVALEMSKVMIQFKENLGEGTRGRVVKDKDALLKEWSKIDGVYIPSFFDGNPVNVDGSRIITVTPKFEYHGKINRVIVSDLDAAHFPESPVVAYGKPVHDRLRLEISRGCSRGCRFCQAGMIYRPVRERSPKKVISLAEKCIASTGYEDISLLSLSTGDYGAITSLLRNLMTWCGPEKIAVSFPSLRAGTLTPQLMEMVKKVRKTGFTIAPEAGSQRLRDIINKNISTEQIQNTVQNAVDLGWQVIKLYFMIGLPGETKQDLLETIELVKQLRGFKNSAGNKIKLNVSFTTFIPKAHTPFQWEGQASLEYSKDTLAWLKKELKLPGVQVKWQQAEVSLIEGLYARGDRSLCELLESAFEHGARFDGWSDGFNFERWMECAGKTNIDIDSFTTRNRAFKEPLPWDHIDTGIKKEFLWEERTRAFQGQVTGDCRKGDCMGCGACDFKRIRPVLKPESELQESRILSEKQQKPDEIFKRIEITYEKVGPAKFFGHLEMVNIWLRAIRRSNIRVQYSKGFHPMPKVSFDNPLPVGVESYEEKMFLNVDKNIDIDRMCSKLKSQMPTGLNIRHCRLAPKVGKDSPNDPIGYEIELKNKHFEKDALDRFMEASEFYYAKTNRKGKTKRINLKELVTHIQLRGNCRIHLTLMQGKAIVRASEIIREIFSLDDVDIKTARIIKLAPKN